MGEWRWLCGEKRRGWRWLGKLMGRGFVGLGRGLVRGDWWSMVVRKEKGTGGQDWVDCRAGPCVGANPVGVWV